MLLDIYVYFRVSLTELSWICCDASSITYAS